MDMGNDHDRINRILLMPKVESKTDLEELVRRSSPDQESQGELVMIEANIDGNIGNIIVKQEPADRTMFATNAPSWNTRIKNELIAGTVLDSGVAPHSNSTDAVDGVIKGETIWVQSLPSGDCDRKQPHHNLLDTSTDRGGSSKELSPLRTDNQRTSGSTMSGSPLKKQGTKRPKLKCSRCKRAFHNKQQLHVHVTTHNFTCKICSKRCKRSVHYEGHMREHRGGSNPYWCDKCPRKYSSYGKLATHISKHRLKVHCECKICGKVFTRTDNYEKHLTVHNNKALNKCAVCGVQFARQSYLTSHMAVHQDKKPFECVVCDMGFNFKYLLGRHLRVHTGQPLTAAFKSAATCEVCGKVFQSKRVLDEHMNVHTGNKPFGCRFCDQKFAQESTRRSHETTHGSHSRRVTLVESTQQLQVNINAAFSCNLCPLSFATKRCLDNHTESAHSTCDLRRFSCEVCGRSYSSVAHLKLHLTHSHSESSAVLSRVSVPTGTTCPVCGKKVKMMSSHKRVHQERMYVCRECGMKFVTSQQLQRHQFVHSGDKPYKCGVCDRGFVDSWRMALHEASHMKTAGDRVQTQREKKYKCDTCGKMFVDNYHLRRHKLVHTRDRSW